MGVKSLLADEHTKCHMIYKQSSVHSSLGTVTLWIVMGRVIDPKASCRQGDSATGGDNKTGLLITSHLLQVVSLISRIRFGLSHLENY